MIASPDRSAHIAPSYIPPLGASTLPVFATDLQAGVFKLRTAPKGWVSNQSQFSYHNSCFVNCKVQRRAGSGPRHLRGREWPVLTSHWPALPCSPVMRTPHDSAQSPTAGVIT